MIKRDVQVRDMLPAMSPFSVAEPPGQSARGRLLRALLASAVLAVCVGLLAQRVEPSRLWAALGRADLLLLFLAALLNLTLNLAVRIERWRLLLGRLPLGTGTEAADPTFPAAQRLGRGRLWLLYMAHLCANNLLPARAGEALRVLPLAGPSGYAVSGLVAVLLVEKVIETLSMGLVAAAVLLFWSPPPSLIGTLRWMLGLGLLGLLLLGLAAQAGARGGTMPGRLRAFLLRLLSALRLLHTPSLWAGALAWSLLSIAADVTMIGLCLFAVGTPLPILHWLLLFFAINLAIALPVTPGQVGVLEAGAVVALSLFGIGPSEALAFALLYHACHVLPTTLLGTLALVRLRLRRWYR